MALFGKKKTTDTKTEEKGVALVKSSTATKSFSTDRNLSSVIKHPRITEKSVNQGEQNVYMFEVRRDATKFEVRDAVKAFYNVTPIKVNIVNKQPAERHVGSRNRDKHVPGMKKAYVYLKQGESINLI
jgi:large subunit ribosomal protein L23